MTSDPKLVQAVFLKVVEVPSAERPALLDLECAGDSDLRQRVETLLIAHDQPDSFLDRPVAHLISTTDSITDPRVGPYKLLERLGEGGMGTVWIAEQDAPIKRRIALKIIKLGMDSAQVIRRFEQERQALALMDHANIAKILDAGVTEGRGRPYFVMELIKGVPITTYCDELHLSVRERLELFVPVCRAIQHAHQKGIIHRDIKPSNVLVCIQDGRPVPKVIDFGIAKAVNQKLIDDTIHTGIGTVVGTLEYMCPEQAELSALDIDTRADVYGLGVLLYELLTGTTPLDGKRLRASTVSETLRRIREEEPPAPSTRLTQSNNTLAGLAARRRTEPARLTREVRGELDWVVMKCLEKDRTRRYDAANGLARDIERYLHDEPVEASPPSTVYRVKKFVRRNRAAVIAAGLILATLAIGAVGSTTGLVWALRERDAKESARRDAVDSEGKAVAAAGVSRRQLGEVERYNDILGSFFCDLDPRAAEREGKSLGVLLGERLGQAAAKLDAEAINDPLTVARLQSTLGSSLLALGYPDKAIVLFSKVHKSRAALLGPDDPSTLTAAHILGMAYLEANHGDEAMVLQEDTLARSKVVFGPASAETLGTMNDLSRAYRMKGDARRAIVILEEALALSIDSRTRGHRDTIPTISNLGLAYYDAGDRDEALPLFEEAWKLSQAEYSPGHPVALASAANLAVAYQDAGRLPEALKLYEEGYRHRTDVHGERHALTLTFMNNMAAAYERANRIDEARQLLERAVRLWEEHHGSRTIGTLVAKNNLAAVYRAAGQIPKSLQLAENVLALFKVELSHRHPHTLAAMNNVAVAHLEAGRYAVALPLCLETYNLTQVELTPTHPDALYAAHNLAVAYRETRDYDKAVKLGQVTMERRKRHLGPKHPETIRTMYELSATYRAMKRRDDAITLYRETVDLARRELGIARRETLVYMTGLAGAYRETRMLNAAIPLYLEIMETRTKIFGFDDPETLAAINNLALAYRVDEQPGKAVPLFEEALGHMRKKLAPDARDTVTCAGNLALAYLATRQSEKALPLLPEYLDAKRAELGSNDPRLAVILAQFGLDLLDCGRPADAEKLLRECLKIREPEEPDSWTTFNTRVMLGRCLLGRRDYAAAEPLLLQGYEGMKQRELKIPPIARPRLAEAADSLVELYTAWHKSSDAAEWRAKRANYPPPQAPPPRAGAK